jgi:hypothetical protein
MLKDLTSQKKIDPEVVLAAIKALQEKGWDINPYTVADEAKIPRSTLYRSTELMDIVSKARGEAPGTASAGDDAGAAGSSDSRFAELERRNQELEQLVLELKQQNEALAKEQQNAWQNGYKAAACERQDQPAPLKPRDTTGSDEPGGIGSTEAESRFFDPSELAADFNQSLTLFSPEPPSTEKLFKEEKPVCDEPAAPATVPPPPPLPIQIEPPKVAVSHKLEEDGWSIYGTDQQESPEQISDLKESAAEPSATAPPVAEETLLTETVSQSESILIEETVLAQPDDAQAPQEVLAGSQEEPADNAAPADEVAERQLAPEPAVENVTEPVAEAGQWGAPSFDGLLDPTQSLYSQDFGEEAELEETSFRPERSEGDDGMGAGYYEPNETDIDHKIKTTTLTEDELSDLLKHRFGKTGEEPVEKKEDEAGKKAAGTKFVGGHRPQQEPPPQGFVVRTVPPDIRKACLVLGLRPEEITLETVHKAWKSEMTREHPDKGGDNEIAVYLNTAKDTLYRWLEAQAPKLGKKFGSSTMQFRKPTDKEIADAASNKEDNK